MHKSYNITTTNSAIKYSMLLYSKYLYTSNQNHGRKKQLSLVFFQQQKNVNAHCFLNNVLSPTKFSQNPVDRSATATILWRQYEVSRMSHQCDESHSSSVSQSQI